MRNQIQHEVHDWVRVWVGVLVGVWLGVAVLVGVWVWVGVWVVVTVGVGVTGTPPGQALTSVIVKLLHPPESHVILFWQAHMSVPTSRAKLKVPVGGLPTQRP